MNSVKKIVYVLFLSLIAVLLNNTITSAQEKTNEVLIKSVCYNQDTDEFDITLDSNSEMLWYIENDDLNNPSNTKMTINKTLSIQAIRFISDNDVYLYISYPNEEYTKIDIEDIIDESFIHQVKVYCKENFKETNQYLLAKEIYKWFGENCSYTDNYNENTMYSAFFERKAMSSGLSSLYQIMCKLMGIECNYVNSDISDYNYIENHAWNEIYLNNYNYTYLVDVSFSGVINNNKVDYDRFCNNDYRRNK